MNTKVMVAAVAVLVMVPAMAQAQASNVAVTASVAQHAVLSGTGDLDFGPLSSATDNMVNAAGGAGAALRTLEFNHNVDVTFNTPTVLSNGSYNLPVTLRCAAQQGGSWNAAADCNGLTMPLNVSGGMSTAVLGFGGIINAADVAQAMAGSYSATLTITVTAR